MKKEILINGLSCYEAKYIISKSKHINYYHNRKSKNKYVIFYKNGIGHRPCNIGPQYRSTFSIQYVEKNRIHNLYGYGYINKGYNIKDYYIYGKKYTKNQFKQYINMLNQLNYKRIY